MRAFAEYEAYDEPGLAGLVLRLGSQLEAARPWLGRTPPVVP